jgi:hypothetical protein
MENRNAQAAFKKQMVYEAESPANKFQYYVIIIVAYE